MASEQVLQQIDKVAVKIDAALEQYAPPVVKGACIFSTDAAHRTTTWQMRDPIGYHRRPLQLPVSHSRRFFFRFDCREARGARANEPSPEAGTIMLTVCLN